jgi:hypothetical protein
MSWLLVEKVPMAQAWVNRLLDYTIGTGFDWTIKCDDKRLEKAVQAYVRECLDTSKWSSELERETMVREVSEGEFFGELIYDDGQCMLVAREADELTEPAAKRELEDWLGIEFDASWTFGVLTKKSVPEKHYGYHFVKNAAGTDWDYVPAERVVFWKRNVRQRAKRGYSDFYKPHLYLLRADRVLTNTAEGAATQAAIAYIVEHSEGTQRQADNIVKKFAPLTGRVDPMTGLSQRKRRMLPGTRLDVPAGQNYKAGLLGSNNSDIYISVMESALRLAGTVHAFPEGMLTGSYENNNLASAIVAEGPFVQGRIAEQTQRKERMREMILKIIKLGANNRRFGVHGYATWEAIQDLITVEVIPPKIIPLDPIKHTQALAMQRDKGWVSDKTAMNELGRDIDTETANGLKVAGAEQQAGTGAQRSVQAGNVANKTGKETGQDAGNVATPEAQISSNWQGLSRLQWNRNRRAMADVLADFMAGKTTRQVASVLLKSIGMDDKSIEAILTDAEDGSIDDPMPLTEAERKTLGKPFRTPNGPKKFSVYVKNQKGNVVKVNFGDPKKRIKRQDSGSRRGFRARHNCQDPGPRWKARYWSCRFWSRPSVTKLLKESFSGEYTWDGRTFVRESWLYRQNPRLLEVRDGDGDGKINDGKPSEAPAPKKTSDRKASPKKQSKAQSQRYSQEIDYYITDEHKREAKQKIAKLDDDPAISKISSRIENIGQEVNSELDQLEKDTLSRVKPIREKQKILKDEIKNLTDANASSSEIAKKKDEYKRLISESTAIYVDMEKKQSDIQNKAKGRILKEFVLPEQERLPVKVSITASTDTLNKLKASDVSISDMQSKISSAKQFVSAITAKKEGFNSAYIQIEINAENDRARYDHKRKTIVIGPTDGVSTIAHEIGHALENQDMREDESQSRRSKAWLAASNESGEVLSISDNSRDINEKTEAYYANKENMSRQSRYARKLYNSLNTEVISQGYSRLLDDPGDFVADKEHFKYFAGWLKGK